MASAAEGAHVAVRERDLVAPFVQPREVPARIHQVQPNIHAGRRSPATSAVTSKKSTCAASPGRRRGWVNF